VSAAGPKGADSNPKRARETLAGALLFLAAAGGVALTQPRLARAAHTAGEREDVYALPPPAQLHAATLGWDAAAVDLLWTTLLVQYGEHWQEHRDFTDGVRYADDILAIEPTFEPLYRIVDTLLVYRPLRGTARDARDTRAILERGTRERPYDASLWRRYGEFLAYLAPSFLADPEEQNAWRKDGAAAMEHALELGGDPSALLAAAGVLTDMGERDAVRRFYERAYAMTEHPSMTAIHEQIGKQLAALRGQMLDDRADALMRAIGERWQREMPSVSRDDYLLLGPAVDTARCAGLAGADDPACAHELPQPTPPTSP
jgi:hypothetical protein